MASRTLVISRRKVLLPLANAQEIRDLVAHSYPEDVSATYSGFVMSFEGTTNRILTIINSLNAVCRVTIYGTLYDPSKAALQRTTQTLVDVYDPANTHTWTYPIADNYLGLYLVVTALTLPNAGSFTASLSGDAS